MKTSVDNLRIDFDWCVIHSIWWKKEGALYSS